MHKNLINGEHMAAAIIAAALEESDMRKIKFRCPCGKRLVEPFSRIGHKGYCPKCRRGMRVPRFNEQHVTAVRCECGFDVPIGLIRKGLDSCPRCGRNMRLPGIPLWNKLEPLVPLLLYGGLSLLAIITFALLIIHL